MTKKEWWQKGSDAEYVVENKSMNVVGVYTSKGSLGCQHERQYRPGHCPVVSVRSQQQRVEKVTHQLMQHIRLRSNVGAYQTYCGLLLRKLRVGEGEGKRITEEKEEKLGEGRENLQSYDV